MVLNRWLIFLFLFLFFSNLKAQQTRIEWIHHEDGLPNDLIKWIDVDSLGFVWVATDNGLVKIEGKNYMKVELPDMTSKNFKKVISSKRYGVVAISDPAVLTIHRNYSSIYAQYFSGKVNHKWAKITYPKNLYEALDSSIWIADNSNLYWLKSDTILTYKFNQKNHTEHYSRSYQVFESDKQNLYVFSEPGYLYKLNKSSNVFEEIKFEYGGEDIYCVEKVNDSTFLAGTNKGFYKITFNSKGLIKDFTKVKLKVDVSYIKKRNNKELIIGSWREGAYTGCLIDSVCPVRLLKGSEKQIINHIAIDNQNQVWLGTDMGIMLYRNLVFSEPFKHDAHSYIFDIDVDNNGKYVFAFVNKCMKVDENGKAEIFYQADNDLVLSLVFDSEGVWIGTKKGKLLYKSFEGKIIKNYSFGKQVTISNISIDNEGHVWFVKKENNKTELMQLSANDSLINYTLQMRANNYIRTIKLLKNGQFYIGASGNNSYLYRYNYELKKIENISLPFNALKDRPMLMYDIGVNDKDELILATSIGLWRYTHDTIIKYDIGDMTNELVTAVEIDRDNSIWFANSNGVINYLNGKYTIYNNNDGLPAKTTDYQCIKKNSNGNLIVGTISGLGIGYVKNRSVKTPKPVLSFVEKSGMKIDFSIENRFLQNSLLSFTFATPVYPAKYVQYQYSLNSNNDTIKWINFESYTDKLIFNTLGKGEYHLKVRAKNKGNCTWSKPAEFNFSVYKIWYLRPEVHGLIYFMVILLSFVYIQFDRAKSEKEKHRLEKIIAQRTIDLKDQNEELKTLNNNLQLSKERAEAAIATKDRFFSILAHDLKSPFNSIIGFSRILLHDRKDLPEDTIETAVGEIVKTSENTFKLLQNLLDWAMSQTGALKIQKEYIDLQFFFNEVLQTIEPFAVHKNIRLDLQLEKEIAVYADRKMFETIIRNLVNNAIKYSYKKSIVVIKGNVSEHMTQVSISDSGVGIPEDKLNQIFEVDSSFSTLGTNKEKGTGLGLVLCKEFVEKNNGTIGVESSYGKGTTFYVKLPFSD